MFKWIKKTGCNCHPVESGCERYFLNVGDVWGGTVESHPCEHEPGKVFWESWYTVCGEKVSGSSGGGDGRDDCMSWIELRILDEMAKIRLVEQNQKRQIFGAFLEANPVTGEIVQREIP